jgi:hypothetical protein
MSLSLAQLSQYWDTHAYMLLLLLRLGNHFQFFLSRFFRLLLLLHDAFYIIVRLLFNAPNYESS